MKTADPVQPSLDANGADVLTDNELGKNTFVHRCVTPGARKQIEKFALEVRNHLEKAKRSLEAKDPQGIDNSDELKKINYLISSMTPAYIPIFSKDISDKKSALGQIGGGLFTSKEYPTPRDHEGEPLAPLVQLSLDKISKQTAIDVGSGLLQVWMDSDTWGQGVETFCRVIPQKHFNKSDSWPDEVEQPRTFLWEEKNPDSDFNVVYGVWADDPEYEDHPEYENLMQDVEYWGGVSGFDWSLSSLLENKSIVPPVYIVDWYPIGLNVPSYGLTEALWDYESWGEVGSELNDALKYIHGAYPDSLKYLPVHLDFCLGLWSDENELCGWGKKYDLRFDVESFPLFLFDGPLSNADPVEDTHLILFRRLPSGEFEFQSKCLRWSF